MPEQIPISATESAYWPSADDEPHVHATGDSWRAALRSATLLEQAHDAIVGVGADATITVWNRGAERLYGHSNEDAIGAQLTTLLPASQLQSERRILRRVLDGEMIERETRRVRIDGTVVEVSVLSSPIRDGSGEIVAVCEIARDIEERKIADARLQHLARHDALTGLLNRHAFETELERAVTFAKRYDLDTALLIVDIDRFKLVNDTYGHHVGDAALRRLADLMRRRLRRTDVIGRIGGDEFAIVLPGVDLAQACHVAEELLEVLRSDRSIAVNETIVALTASVGVSRIGSDDASPSELLARSDGALYEAKRGGRDRVAEAPPRDISLTA